MFVTTNSRWRALQTRCPSSKSAFVYAVLTTRIYCRPTCPARLARRANVVFYDTAAAASAHGFRACKRCKPEQNQITNNEQVLERTITRACRLMEEAEGSVGTKDLAAMVGLSPRYFHEVFKKVVGVTPGAYAEQLKQKKNQITDNVDGEEPRQGNSVSEYLVDVDNNIPSNLLLNNVIPTAGSGTLRNLLPMPDHQPPDPNHIFQTTERDPKIFPWSNTTLIPEMGSWASTSSSIKDQTTVDALLAEYSSLFEMEETTEK
ncbi:MAG: hypothetical protein M1834_006163 [Cirrosporium novae-zelandiae]|nr:MAG: hypothetical protein M1834_006163 [Cirrosporium novae-zelandiae]